MKRGGVRSSVDVGRLSAAVSRPGIDPRKWIDQCRVIDVGYDAEFGMYAEVQSLIDGDTETCFIGSDYAGADFGTFRAPKIGDIVIVAFPLGNQSAGPVIIARFWMGVAPPPEEFKAEDGADKTDATHDPTTVVEPARTLKVIARKGSSIRLQVEGDGKIEIAATGNAEVRVTSEKAVIVDSPDVRLGDAPGSQVARIGDMVVGSTPAMVASGNPVTPTPPAVATASGGVPIVGQIVSGARSVKA